MKKLLSLGQVVKNMHKNNFSNSYFLYGNDIFMQDFFISELNSHSPAKMFEYFFDSCFVFLEKIRLVFFSFTFINFKTIIMIDLLIFGSYFLIFFRYQYQKFHDFNL